MHLQNFQAVFIFFLITIIKREFQSQKSLLYMPMLFIMYSHQIMIHAYTLLMLNFSPS